MLILRLSCLELWMLAKKLLVFGVPMTRRPDVPMTRLPAQQRFRTAVRGLVHCARGVVVTSLLLFCSLPLLCQTNTGELRLRVVDPSGLPVKTAVLIVSPANQYRHTLATNDDGSLVVQRLPYGTYQVDIKAAGFSPLSQAIEIRSSILTEHTIQLKLPLVNESLDVSSTAPLVDPERPGAVSQIGSDQIQTRLSSLPGRSVQDLVNSQPGWLYEGNAVLHPRGSEYQTQFVVDGIPLTDNRSPSLGPEIEADNLQSMNVYTAGIPAEYGRKMGGVVELNTQQDVQQGFHGQVVLSGGSFDSAGAFGQGQYTWGKNTLGASASGSLTDHYLNPVVAQNFSNTGTLGDFSISYQRDLTDKDRLRFTVRREIARYDIPNELAQQQAGQRRPIEVFQHDHFGEGYFKGTITIVRGRHEWKLGVESDNTFLNENFSYRITDPTQFDPGTPLTLSFLGRRPDLEQSVFAQDLMHLGTWTLSAGLRWDHYQLLVNRQGFEPRLALSRYLPSAGIVFHLSYDRIFQTPSFENILLSSSAAIESLDPRNFLRLALQPSQGNYYETGFSKGFLGKLRLDGNVFRRDVNNYADDDQIQNTTISFPIAFRKAVIYGAEGKIDIPYWNRFSGFLSYSYMVGNVWFPVTGGLFLGANASSAETHLTGHFPDSQDQRQTLRGRLRYQLRPRFWVAAGAQFDSGLRFQFDGDASTVLAQYGQGVLNRINFARGRIYPSFLLNASVGADVYKSERVNMRLQIDGQNLTNVLDVIDFGGLFSGNAIGPSRSYSLRLTTTF